MRKLTTLINMMVLAAVFFLAGTTSNMAAAIKTQVGGTVLIFSGTYQQFPPGTTGTTSGPFMCSGGELLNIATSVSYFFDGICDDVQLNSAGLPACDGRFTARFEGCSDPGRDIKNDGGPNSVTSVNFHGQFELCFAAGASPALPADCWGAGGATGTTVGTVYATGTSLSQTRFVSGLAGTPISTTIETTLTSSTKFTDVNGIKVDAEKLNGAIGHLTVEPNIDPPVCGFTPGSPGSPGFGAGSGCGFAGVSVKGK